jgi:RNA polymerase sigma-70 factor (ECF subfamily)
MPHPNRSVPDLTLLGWVASGDAAALRELVQRHGSSVYALAYGIVIDPGEADEVVAETFAYVWLSAGRFVETAHASVATWLGDVARSRARAVLLSREWTAGWSPLERAAEFTT